MAGDNKDGNRLRFQFFFCSRLFVFKPPTFEEIIPFLFYIQGALSVREKVFSLTSAHFFTQENENSRDSLPQPIEQGQCVQV